MCPSLGVFRLSVTRSPLPADTRYCFNPLPAITLPPDSFNLIRFAEGNRGGAAPDNLRLLSSLGKPKLPS
jgi:hypothetical protein